MTLRLVIDVNLSPDWVPALNEAGFPAVHWSQVENPSAPDEEIMAWAATNGHTVFTHDLDFSAMLAQTRAGRPSVIQLRGPRVLPEQPARFERNVPPSRNYSGKLPVIAGALVFFAHDNDLPSSGR